MEYIENGKRSSFEQLGFSAKDSIHLQTEYEKQAAEKYAIGDYSLVKLDDKGQRMDIDIEFSHPTRGIVKFISGWMIRPKGYISCNTPLGG